MANEARRIQPIGAKRGAYSKLNPQFVENCGFFLFYRSRCCEIIRFLNSQFSIKSNTVSLLPSEEGAYVF